MGKVWLLVALLAAGCGRTDCASCQRYELVSAKDGLYKIDRQTGQVWRIEVQYTFEVFSPEETGKLMRGGKTEPPK